MPGSNPKPPERPSRLGKFMLSGFVLLCAAYAIYLVFPMMTTTIAAPSSSKSDTTVSAAGSPSFTGYKIDPALGLDPENTVLLQLKDGIVAIKMRPDLAPEHVKRIKQLVREGFYNGLVFHRVIDGFMAQTGDPTGTGTGGSGKNIKAEFSNEKFLAGTVGMARSSDPNSADSQLFICFAPASFLNGQYTVIGQVVSGMEYVGNIKRGDPQSGSVAEPRDKIIAAQVLADVG